MELLSTVDRYNCCYDAISTNTQHRSRRTFIIILMLFVFAFGSPSLLSSEAQLESSTLDVFAIKSSQGNHLDGAIAFSSNRANPDALHTDIYVMKSDGSGVKRVTTQGGQKPDWSPDNTKIVYSTLATDADWCQTDIYSINVDGTGLQIITVGGTDPRWSPDGTKIAFASARAENSNCNYDVYTMNTDGTNITRITTLGGHSPDWSPDGNKIVYSSGRGCEPDFPFCVPVMYVINADGSSEELLGAGANPRWSPDGNQILSFTSGDDIGSTAMSVFRLNAFDSRSIDVCQSPVNGCPLIDASQPSWASSNDSIVFTGSLGFDKGSHIYFADLDGENVVRLTDGVEFNRDPVWSKLVIDSDEDGLADVWETNGVSVDPDGSGPLPAQFIDLKRMGADPRRPDVFVQADWMDGALPGQNMRPSPKALRIVHNSFANAPLPINLHIDNGPDSIMIYESVNNPDILWGDLSKAGKRPFIGELGKLEGDRYNWNAFNDRYRDEYFTPTGRVPIFHYALFANKIPGGYSGVAQLNERGDGSGSAFIVSLGGFDAVYKKFQIGSERVQAGTFMHELGHNLGLDHGGDDDVRFKPNYLSVMNYAFQFNGLAKNGQSGWYDYSRAELPPLNELHLNEQNGLRGNTDGTGSKDYGTVHFCPRTADLDGILDFRSDLYNPVYPANGEIDWNCSNKIDIHEVSYHIIGNKGNCPQEERPRCTTLEGYNDWANINFRGGSIGQLGAQLGSSPLTPLNELTLEVALQIPPIEWVEEQQLSAQQTAMALSVTHTAAQGTPTTIAIATTVGSMETLEQNTPVPHQQIDNYDTNIVEINEPRGVLDSASPFILVNNRGVSIAIAAIIVAILIFTLFMVSSRSRR